MTPAKTPATLLPNALCIENGFCEVTSGKVQSDLEKHVLVVCVCVSLATVKLERSQAKLLLNPRRADSKGHICNQGLSQIGGGVYLHKMPMLQSLHRIFPSFLIRQTSLQLLASPWEHIFPLNLQPSWIDVRGLAEQAPGTSRGQC